MSDMQLNTHPIEINLLQLEEKKQIDQSSILKPLILLALLLIGSGGVGWLWKSAADARDRTNMELANVNAAIAKLQEEQRARTATADQSIMPLMATLAQDVEQARPDMTAMLDKIKKMLSRNTNVTSLEYTAGGKVVISARFANIEDIITFLGEAKSTKDFQNIRLTQNNGSKDDRKNNSSDDEAGRQFAIPNPPGEVTDKFEAGWQTTIEMEYKPAQTAEQGGEQ